MLNHTVSISNLILYLDSKFGKHQWLNLEPETIMLELGETNPLLAEKLYVAQHVTSAGVKKVMSDVDFLLKAVPVLNNEPAEFEVIEIPTSLELAWALNQFQMLSILLGEPFEVPPEFSDLCRYVLRSEGFSKPVEPFSFVKEDDLTPGQTKEDTDKKVLGIQTYFKYMRSIGNV